MTAALAPVIGTIGESPGLEPPYSSMEMVALTGASYRQIDFWCRTKRLPDTAQGTGMAPRTFTATDLMVTSLVVRLVEFFSVDRSFFIAHQLLEQGEYTVPVGNGYELTVRPVAP